MIQFRRNPFSETAIVIPFKENEKGSQLIDRVLEDNNYPLTPEIYQHINLLVNGHIVPRDLWSVTGIFEQDSVLIGPRIARGSGGQLFKQIASIVIIAAGVALSSTGIGAIPGAGLTGFGLALAGAAIAIGTTLALNALIPPPNVGVGSIGDSALSVEGSQMYSITSQANSIKKFGYVPKVYGTHRIFPTVAANPYTEIEADPETGTLVQFFYCVYDMGFGPLTVTDIKIGDTFLTDYANADFRLVDFNKPSVSSGPWDDVLHGNLQFYKGDSERDGTSVAIDRNQSDGGPLDDYQFVRNASDRVQGANQEIILDFVAPNGLIAYGTDGSVSLRNIDLLIEFSKIGVDDWKQYNDSNFVSEFSQAGGQVTIYSDVPGNILPLLVPSVIDWPSPSYVPISYYSLLQRTEERQEDTNRAILDENYNFIR